MALPTKDEISQAIEKPGKLNIPQLQGFSPIPGILGPESYSGGFCIVFPFVKGSEKKAVRVWHQEIGNIKQRYNLISPDIHNYGIPYLCDVTFVEDALEVEGTKVDVVVMEWIDGVPLKDYIETILDSHQSDTEKKSSLRTLATKLSDMFNFFHSLGFSHGDLQHENILVTPNGEIKLIDYDCFYTRALGNKYEQTTSGYKGYQHPKRFSSNIISNEKADYFSELIIYLSIIAISEDFSLWDIAKDSDFSFLLTEQDFDDLNQSSLATRISSLSKECGELINILLDYLKCQDINDLYPFTDALIKNKVIFRSSSDKAIRDLQTIALNWEMPFEAKVSLFQDGIQVLEGESNGQYSSILHDDTAYKLVIDTPQGQHVEKEISIKVFDECKIDFSADKYYVFPTIPVVLSWNVTNAKKVWLDSEEVEAIGTKVVEPKKEMTCVLSAEDEFGIKEKRIDIQMLPIPQVTSLLASTPNFVSNMAVTIQQPRFNVDVKFPQIDIGWIKVEVPRVPSLTDLGLNVELSPPLPKFSLMSSIKRVFNHLIQK